MKRLPFTKLDTFGDRVRLLRLLFQITQEQLASVTGLLQGTLAKIERDVYVPDAEVFQRVAEFLQTTEGYLRYGEAPVFRRRLAFCELLASLYNPSVREFLLQEGIPVIVHHLANVDRIEKCFRSEGRHVTVYVMSYEGKPMHHLIIRADSRACIDQSLAASGVKVEVLSDKAVLKGISNVYARPNRTDGDLSPARAMIIVDKNLQRFFGPFSPEDVLTRESILSAVTKSNRILVFCERIGAEEGDLAQALKDYRNRQVG